LVRFLVVTVPLAPPTRLRAVLLAALALTVVCAAAFVPAAWARATPAAEARNASAAGAAAAAAAARVGSTAGAGEAPAAGVPAPVRRPSRAGGATVAKILLRTPLRTRAGGGRVVWTARPQTPYNGLPQRLMVLRERLVDGRRWLQVRLPTRPNDATGWLLRDAVALESTRWWIDVSVGARSVVVRRDGAVVKRMRAVVGAPATPTPRGLFAIYEKVRQPDPRAFLGTWALHLSAHSNVLDDYGGGDGRAALHGRSGASLADPLGSARSHGCVRLDNRAVDWLAARIPAGTPVRIGR
jgi:lipoprotein-anchoring transpeptidase ErfK/SrfK